MTSDSSETSGGKSGGASAAESPALDVITKFGGIRPMATKLGIAVTTVQGWKERGVIPAPRHKEVLAAAAEQGIEISADDLVAGDLSPEDGSAPGKTEAAPSSSATKATASGPSKDTAAKAAAVGAPSAIPVSGAGRDTDSRTARAEDVGSGSKPPSEPKAASSGSFKWRAGAAVAVVGLIAAAGAFSWWKWIEPGVVPWESAKLGMAGDDGKKSREVAAVPPKPATSGSKAPGVSGGAAGGTPGSVRKPGEARRAGDSAGGQAGQAAKNGETAEEKTPAREKRDAEVKPPENPVDALKKKEALEKEEKTEKDAALRRRAEAEKQAGAGQPPPAGTRPADGNAGSSPAGNAQPKPEAPELAGPKTEPEAKVAQQAPAKPAAPKTGETDAALKEQSEAVAVLKKEVTDLREANAGLVAALKATQDRMAALEKKLETGAGAGATQSTLALAAGQLREAVLKGRPYAAEVKVLKGLAAENAPAAVGAAVTILEPHADTGVATDAALRASFSAIAWDVVKAGRLPANPSTGDKLMSKLGDIFSVRRTGADAVGPGSDAVVARAEARLSKGDLAGAVKELESLTGRAAEQAAPWMTRARARLAAEDAVDSLSRAAIASLAGAGGSE